MQKFPETTVWRTKWWLCAGFSRIFSSLEVILITSPSSVWVLEPPVYSIIWCHPCRPVKYQYNILYFVHVGWEFWAPNHTKYETNARRAVWQCTVLVNFNCCFTVHFDKYKAFLPTNALFIRNIKCHSLYLKYRFIRLLHVSIPLDHHQGACSGTLLKSHAAQHPMHTPQTETCVATAQQF